MEFLGCVSVKDNKKKTKNWNVQKIEIIYSSV